MLASGSVMGRATNETHKTVPEAFQGSCHVDEATHKEWASGGELKEWLELALLEVLKEVGTDSGPAAFKKVKVPTAWLQYPTRILKCKPAMIDGLPGQVLV